MRLAFTSLSQGDNLSEMFWGLNQDRVKKGGGLCPPSFYCFINGAFKLVLQRVMQAQDRIRVHQGNCIKLFPSIMLNIA